MRILTVADVHDALTADRVYREAWPLERALAILDEDTGSAFDGECVKALKAVVALEQDAVTWRASLANVAEHTPRAASPAPFRSRARPWCETIAPGEPMIDIVRRSKITPPRLPSAPVVRPRVHALLDAAARKPVTLVSASAGYGKSIAVATWLAERRVNTAWVSVDGHDNDPLHLWSYVIGAAEHALPGSADEPSRRARAAEATAEPAIEALLAALAEQPRPLTIVLDDLHLLTDLRALASVDYAEQRLPPNVRLIAVTRVDPPLRGLPACALTACWPSCGTPTSRSRATRPPSGCAARTPRRESSAASWPVALQLGALRGEGVPVTGRRKDVAAYLTAEVIGGSTRSSRTSSCGRRCCRSSARSQATTCSSARTRRRGWPRSRARTCSSSRSTTRAAGSATTRCSRSTCARGSARPRHCTVAPQRGSRSTA